MKWSLYFIPFIAINRIRIGKVFFKFISIFVLLFAFILYFYLMVYGYSSAFFFINYSRLSCTHFIRSKIVNSNLNYFTLNSYLHVCVLFVSISNSIYSIYLEFYRSIYFVLIFSRSMCVMIIIIICVV